MFGKFGKSLIKSKFFKEVKCSNIPKAKLQMKSVNRINDYIDIYYINAGKSVLSVLKDENNDTLEIIRKLSSISDYFRPNFSKILINKYTGKLLGYEYSFEVENKDFTTVANIVAENEEVSNILNEIGSLDQNQVKGFLVKVLYIYEILTYVNKIGISVKELKVPDMQNYTDNQKIYCLNAIAKLKLTTKDESSDIATICLEYMEDRDIYKYLGYEFKEFIKSGNIIEFERELIKQIQNMKKFTCGHEFEKSFVRCPVCNIGDFIIEDSELETLNSPKLCNDKFSIYKCNLEKRASGIILFNDIESLSLNTLMDYLATTNGVKEYDIIYDEKVKFVGLRIKNDESFKYMSANDYIETFFDKVDFPKEFSFEQFFRTFIAIGKEIEELKISGFNVEFEDNKLLEQFIVINGKSPAIFVSPTSLTKEESNFSITKVVVELIFGYFKEYLNNSNKVSLFDPIIYIEYSKYIAGKEFDYIRVYNRLLTLNSSETFKSFIASEGYSNLYDASPMDADIKLLEGEELDIPDGYELCRSKLDESLVKSKKKKYDIIYPEKVIYRLQKNEVVYEGYIIKIVQGIHVLEAFKYLKYSNKEYINMLKLYRQQVKYNPNFPVRYAYFTEDFTQIFYKYNMDYSINSTTIKDYFFTLIDDLSASNIYLSNAIEIYSKRNGKTAIKGLENLLNDLTNYCEEHNTWYEKEIKKCPICNKFYLYLDTKALSGNVVFENEFWKLIKYKNAYIKIFKKNTLENGKSIYDLNIEVLEGNSIYYKIIKDSTSETTVGLLLKNEVVSLKDLLHNYKNSNKTYLEIAMRMLNKYRNMYFYFEGNENIDELLERKIFSYSGEIFYIDAELFTQNDIAKKMYTHENILLLDKMIKYILSYNSKYAYEFGAIEYPEIDINYMDNLYQTLRHLDASLSSFCDEHNAYYNPEYGMCPICVDNSDTLILTKKTQLGKKSGKGGEANIFNLGQRRLAKLYNFQYSSKKEDLNEYLAEEEKIKMEKRQYVVEVLKQVYKETKDDLKNREFGIVFPQKDIQAKTEFGGFVQERVKDPISFSSVGVDKELNLGRLDILKLLIDFGDAIEYLHNSPIIRRIIPDGIVVGDISSANALYSKYDKKIYIIDMDSICLKEYPYGKFFTLKFYDPLMKNRKPSFETDWYAYAILCFFTLTKFHPFDGTYLEVGGKIMSLEDRKINKISILGSKRVKLPNPVDCNWMSKELKKAFLEIFEKEKRYSIVDLLKKEYNRLSGEEKYDFVKEILLKTKKITLDNNKELSVVDNKILLNGVVISDINFNPVEEEIPEKLIEDIEVDKNYGVLLDKNNEIYLILSNTNSYVMYKGEIQKFSNVYKANLCNYEVKRYMEEGKFKNLFYERNCLYYVVDGYICCIDLVKDIKNKLPCDHARYGGFIRIIDNRIIVGDDCLYYVTK